MQSSTLNGSKSFDIKGIQQPSPIILGVKSCTYSNGLLLLFMPWMEIIVIAIPVSTKYPQQTVLHVHPNVWDILISSQQEKICACCLPLSKEQIT